MAILFTRKAPTGDFPYGIVKRSYIKDDVAVSPPCTVSICR